MRKVYRVEAHIYVMATSSEEAQSAVYDLRFEDMNSGEPAGIKVKEITSIEDVITLNDQLDLDRTSLFQSNENEWNLPLKHFLSPEFQLTEIIET